MVPQAPNIGLERLVVEEEKEQQLAAHAQPEQHLDARCYPPPMADLNPTLLFGLVTVGLSEVLRRQFAVAFGVEPRSPPVV